MASRGRALDRRGLAQCMLGRLPGPSKADVFRMWMYGCGGGQKELLWTDVTHLEFGLHYWDDCPPPPHPPGVLGGRRMWQEDEEAAISFCGASDDG